jgi:hypothetical protein
MSFQEAEAKKEIDTIPKPVGLGPRVQREARSVRCTFIEHSTIVRCSFDRFSKGVHSRRRFVSSRQRHFRWG